MDRELNAMTRRCPTRTLLAAVTGLLIISTSPLTADDWPQYRGANHDGVSKEKILMQWPADGLRQLWRIPLNTGFSSFAVAQNKAFTLVQRSIQGADQEVCIALDADTGKELWAIPLGQAKYDGGGDSGAADNRGGDGPRSTPTINGNRLYVLSAYLSLFCLDAQTGELVWRKDVSKEYGGKVIAWQNAASPLIDGDLIFLNGNAPGQSLMAFQKQDGRLAWKGQTDKMTQATPITATILGVRQIIFFTQTGLVSVASKDGAVLWRYAFPYKVSTAASPVVAGDIVYCSAGYDVGSGAVKITKSGDQFTATELWRVPGNKISSHWSTPVYFDGHLYGLFGFKEFGKCPLKCLEVATGKEVWSKDGFGPGGVLLVDGHILVLGDKGQLALVQASPKAYTEVARAQPLTGKCWNSPALSNGRIYARGTKEGVCLDVAVK